jgi:hypothetical protein
LNEVLGNSHIIEKEHTVFKLHLLFLLLTVLLVAACEQPSTPDGDGGGNDPPAKTDSAVLKLVATVQIPATDSFIAAAKFKKGNADGVPIDTNAPSSGSFQLHFLGKVELNIPATTLNVYEARRTSSNDTVFSRRGDTAVTTLYHLWELLKGTGQQGSALNVYNGTYLCNLSNTPDVNGDSYIVQSCNSSRGWWFEAWPVTSIIHVTTKTRVVSH